MSTADGGHQQTCQALVLEDFRPSSPWGLTGGVKPQQTPPSSKKKLYLCVSLHHKYFCFLDCCTFVSLSTERLSLFCWRAGAFLSVKSMPCCGLGQNIILEVGKTAIGRLLPLWNVTCTPKPTARLRKLLGIFNSLGWSWPQLCIS